MDGRACTVSPCCYILMNMTEKHFTWCPLPDILESWGKPDLGYNNFMIARWKDRKNIGSWWFSWWARTNMEAQIPLNFLHLKCNTFLSHCVLVAQSCLTLCSPVDCSLPGSSVHGILQARILQWVAISFSRGSSRLRDQTQVSCIVGGCFTIWATRLVWMEFSIICGLMSPNGDTC